MNRYLIAAIAGALGGGTVSDRLGRKPVLLAVSLIAPLLVLAFLRTQGWLMVLVLILTGLLSLAGQLGSALVLGATLLTLVWLLAQGQLSVAGAGAAIVAGISCAAASSALTAQHVLDHGPQGDVGTEPPGLLGKECEQLISGIGYAFFWDVEPGVLIGNSAAPPSDFQKEVAHVVRFRDLGLEA